MKAIVTHQNPHIDEVACIWMVKRFLKSWDSCAVKYVATNPKGGAVKAPDKSPDVMYIGVGRGKFDEHKGNLEDSATTLVHKFLTREKKIKLSKVQQGALEELVSYINDEDHGKLITNEFAEFSVASANAYLPRVGYKSAAILNFGMVYLDGVFECLIEKHLLAQDWKRAKMVSTKWGKAVALSTTVNAKSILRHAVKEGIEIAIILNPKNKFRSIRAIPACAIDLTAAFELAHAAEPKAEWYLHHGKKMLICGSDVAENFTLSRMTLDKLIALVAV